MKHKVTILGRIAVDPQLQYTSSGRAVLNFSIPANETWKDKATGEKREKTVWFRCAIFGDRAEALNWLKKGHIVEVEGRLPEEITIFAKKDGSNGASYEITVDNLTFIHGEKSNDYEPAKTPDNSREDDDIPF